jgi:hypothetical protein
VRRSLTALFLLLGSCSDDIEPAQPLLNRCTQDFECDTKDTCDEALGICVRPTVDVDAQYPFALQIAPTSSTLVSNVTVDPQPLTAPIILPTVVVPNAVKVSGKVLFESVAREAELVFRRPNTNPTLRPPVTVITLPAVPGTTENQSYATRLEPNMAYEVDVYPVGAASWELPPQTFPLSVEAADLPHDFTYGDRVAFRGRLLDENGRPMAGRKLRLRSEMSHDTVSSLGRTDAFGDFTVWTTGPVLDQLARHDLQIELALGEQAWSTTIVVEGERLRIDGGVTVPVVPAPVLFEASVEVADRVGVEYADVTFRSSFPLPPEAGQVNGRDWCRTRTSMDGGIGCGTERLVPLGTESTISALLLPGDYDIYIQPRSRDSNNPQPVRTVTEKVRIETKPDGGAQQGSFFWLPPAKLFGGTVMSPRHRPMPFVGVTAQALGYAGELGDVARYNRTANTLSDGEGRFRLAVDIGYYDLLGQPPEGSGFAWTIWPNRKVTEAENPAAGTLSPSSPVLARGRLVTRSGVPVTQAHVDAYAMVPGAAGERPVRIAEAVSDDAGVFVLYLPPQIERDEDDENTPSAEGMDAGVGLDATAPPSTLTTPLIRMR